MNPNSEIRHHLREPDAFAARTPDTHQRTTPMLKHLKDAIQARRARTRAARDQARRDQETLDVASRAYAEEFSDTPVFDALAAEWDRHVNSALAVTR